MSWAIVTGGSRGIGAATCLALARDGFDIAFTFREGSTVADAMGDRIRALGRDVHIASLDLGNIDATSSWASKVADELTPSVLIANAGETLRAPLRDHRPAVVRRLLDVNVVATVELARAFAPALAKSGAGTLVTVSSMSGVRGSSDSVGYSTTKAAMIGLTKALAVELAPAVRVNAVIPGIIDTDMNTSALADPAIVATVTTSVPLGRVGTPTEVAEVIAWLVGPRSGYVTGSVLAADGGALSLFPVH